MLLILHHALPKHHLATGNLTLSHTQVSCMSTLLPCNISGSSLQPTELLQVSAHSEWLLQFHPPDCDWRIDTVEERANGFNNVPSKPKYQSIFVHWEPGLALMATASALAVKHLGTFLSPLSTGTFLGMFLRRPSPLLRLLFFCERPCAECFCEDLSPRFTPQAVLADLQESVSLHRTDRIDNQKCGSVWF